MYYHKYPNITDIDDEYSYNDRYRYGIKFKFMTNGLMGEFNINSLISHLVSGIVLINLSTTIVTYFLIFFTGKYGKDFKHQKYSKSEIREKCYSEKYCKRFCPCSSCAKANENENNQNNENENNQNNEKENNKKRKIEKLNSNEINDESNSIVLPTKEELEMNIVNKSDNDSIDSSINEKIEEIFNIEKNDKMHVTMI